MVRGKSDSSEIRKFPVKVKLHHRLALNHSSLPLDEFLMPPQNENSLMGSQMMCTICNHIDHTLHVERCTLILGMHETKNWNITRE